jgi:P27 family predicted phage terminase small subunit
MPVSGREFGESVAPFLIADGLLEHLYLGPFLAMCSSYAHWLEAQERLSKDGFTITDNRGVTRKSPFVTIEKNYATSFIKFAEDFGLTPMSRQRLSIPDQEGPSLEDILSKDWSGDTPPN